MKKLVLGLSLLLGVSACGTLFNGGSQDIQFDSNVKGTQIYVNGLKACRTPCLYTIDRSPTTVTITAKKEGYEEQYSVLKSELSKKSLINLSSLVAWFTDFVSGGMWQYNRNSVYIEMVREQGSYGSGYQQYNQPKTQQYYYDRYSKNDETGAKTRRFSLYNYGELKSEASLNKSGEYIKVLSELTDKKEPELIKIINNSTNEVNLAHTLTGINH